MNKKKVALINPPRINGISWTREGRCQEKEGTLGTVKPPFSLALLASVLRNDGVEFQLIDATALNLDGKDICNKFLESGFEPDLIIYCTCTPTIVQDTESLSVVKDRFHSKLIALGPHISCAPSESLNELPNIDIGILGEPEETVLDILRKDDLTDLSSIKGVVWRNGKHVYLNEKRELSEDLDSLPIPAWDLFHLDDYVLPFINKKYVLVETSRGCPFGCDFCVAHKIHGLKFRKKSPEVVVDEIETIQKQFNIDFFNLFGDTVTFENKFIEKFCDELIKRELKIKWFTNTRADTLHNEQLVRKMMKSGCWMLSLGIESSSDNTRKNMKKKLQAKKIRNAINLLRETGIMSFGFFIFGYPGETKREMYETMKFSTSLPLDYAVFYPAVPYPGTAFYDKCKKEGYLYDDSWSKMEYTYYILKTEDLNEDIVKKAISHAYMRFYLRPQFIFRHLRNVGMKKFFIGSPKLVLKFLFKNFTPDLL